MEIKYMDKFQHGFSREAKVECFNVITPLVCNVLLVSTFGVVVLCF